MMLRYTDRSRDDLELAFAWYERQRRGLGFDFLDCVETAIQNIITYPEMYQGSWDRNVRAGIAWRSSSLPQEEVTPLPSGSPSTPKPAIKQRDTAYGNERPFN